MCGFQEIYLLTKQRLLMEELSIEPEPGVVWLAFRILGNRTSIPPSNEFTILNCLSDLIHNYRPILLWMKKMMRN